MRRTIGLVEERTNNNPADNHRKIGRQTAASLKFPEQSELIVSQSGKDPLAQDVPFFCPQPDFPLGCRVINYVQDKSEEPIHEIFPSPVLPRQTTFQKRIVQVSRRHNPNENEIRSSGTVLIFSVLVKTKGFLPSLLIEKNRKQSRMVIPCLS